MLETNYEDGRLVWKVEPGGAKILDVVMACDDSCSKIFLFQKKISFLNVFVLLVLSGINAPITDTEFSTLAFLLFALWIRVSGTVSLGLCLRIRVLGSTGVFYWLCGSESVNLSLRI